MTLPGASARLGAGSDRARPVSALLVDLDRALARRATTGAAGGTSTRRLASGAGWSVADVLCTSGPDDHPFEERHDRVSIAIVAAGSFRYRSAAGRALLTPGALLLGDSGECFECGHEHGRGDRCIAFSFEPEHFARIAADAGARGAGRRLRRPRLPPLRALAPLVARAGAGLLEARAVAWDELAVELAARSVALAAGVPLVAGGLPPGAEARVARAVRRIERDPDREHPLAALAAEARLSPYHFLRTFERVTGVTPHQFVLRTRLRAAALALAAGPAPVLEVAYGAGFGDLSNFNRSFRAEFGASPTAFRRATRPAQRDAGGTTAASRA